MGESLDITWTLRKVDQADQIISIKLLLGNFTESKVLYDGTSGLTKRNLAKKMFGERMQASFKTPDYTLTLSNLRFNDTFTFTLAVFQQIRNTVEQRPITLKSVAISVVKGMYFFKIS